MINIKKNYICYYAFAVNVLLCFFCGNASLGIQSKSILFIGLFVSLCVIVAYEISEYKIKRNEIYVAVTIIVMQILASVVSALKELPVGFDLHRIVFWTLMVIACFFCTNRMFLSENDTVVIFRKVVATGIISLVYDVIINIDKLKMIFKNFYYLKWNGRYYTSFFSQRTECAVHAFFCACCCIYLFVLLNKKYYLFVYFLMLGHIILTGARMPLFATLFIPFIMMIIEPKFRKRVLWCAIIIIVLAVLFRGEIYSFANSFIRNYLSHNGMGVDTGVLRLNAWHDLINKTDIFTFLFGYGMGAQSSLVTYYSPYFKVNGYHSMYVDTYCQGGILLLSFIIYICLYTIYRVIKSDLPKEYKSFAVATIIAHMISQITDSVGALFDYQIMSVMSTAFVIGIPLCRVKK